eukprot:IDg3045t1
MGRGKTWDGAENELLARAWITTSEDPVVGTDQTRKVFMDSVRRRFAASAPVGAADGRYGTRSIVSIRQHFADLSADVQKFRLAL